MITSHRPWPLPSQPWIMKQTWNKLLFIHWPISVEKLRPLIPESLEVDTYDGTAWVAVVPFHMSGIRFRFMPPIPSTSSFAEINVRTYVNYGDKPGVYFFSLDAASYLAVKAARLSYHLPYYDAKMSVQTKNEVVHYSTKRLKTNKNIKFAGKYKPISEAFYTEPGSLEHWLTERYCLYTTNKNRVYRGEIHHDPWPLQRAEANIETNTMLSGQGIQISEENPLLHYADRIDVLIWGIADVSNLQ